MGYMDRAGRVVIPPTFDNAWVMTEGYGNVLVGDVRGLGGMCAIELVRNTDTREPADTETKKIAEFCYKHGLVTITNTSPSAHGRVLLLTVRRAPARP